MNYNFEDKVLYEIRKKIAISNFEKQQISSKNQHTHLINNKIWRYCNMNLSLYINTSPKNWVHKNLISERSLTGTLRTPCSVSDPIIEVERDDNTVLDFNYAYIKEFHRYYYITDIVSNNKKLWVIHMHVDVLMSFWDAGISTSMCIVARNVAKKQLDLVDDEMYFTADNIYVQYNFPQNPFNTQIVGNYRNYVLVLAGTDDT